MNKEKRTALILAGLLTINTLGGCSVKNNEMYSQEEPTVSENLDNNEAKVTDIMYKVSTIPASVAYDENESILYTVPEGWILIGDKGYRVEKIYSIEYPATQITDENGKVRYFAPNGGILVGSKVYLTKTVTLDEEEARIVLIEKGYCNEESQSLKMSM